MRKKYFMVLDTETTGLKPFDFIFDLAYVIASRTNVILERQFLVKEIITSPAKMKRAHGLSKLFTFYIPQLAIGNIKMFHWLDIVEQFREDFKNYEIDVFTTYNLPFDLHALQRTNALLGNKVKILPHKPDMLDLWLFACITAMNTKTYHSFASQQGIITDAGNVQTKAEHAYAFLTGEIGFRTDHTALRDAQKETVILQRLLEKKKKIPYNEIVNMPWKYAQILRGQNNV